MTDKLSLVHNKNLKAFNTMGLAVYASHYLSLYNIEQLAELPQFIQSNNLQELPLILLGGGSNIIFQGDIEGLVLHIKTQGFELLNESSTQVHIKVQAGNSWDDFVAYAVAQGYSGLENLSLIPGSVGAAPIQNIGAYGQEVADIIEHVHCMNVYTGELSVFDNSACEFNYRISRFKAKPERGLLVTAVTFTLSKQFCVNINYQPLLDEFSGKPVTVALVRDTVIAIRQSKLPNPSELANTGSFFQNPVVTKAHFNQLIARDANLPNYPQSDGRVKLAAGYLIEQCGFKGNKSDNGSVSMHSKQALVLVNYGEATAQDVLQLAGNVKKAVFQHYQVQLEQEPVLI